MSGEIRFTAIDDDARVVAELLGLPGAEDTKAMEIRLDNPSSCESAPDQYNECFDCNGIQITLGVNVMGEIMDVDERDRDVTELVQVLTRLTGHSNAFELWCAISSSVPEPRGYLATKSTVGAMASQSLEMRTAIASGDPRQIKEAAAKAADWLSMESALLSTRRVA